MTDEEIVKTIRALMPDFYRDTSGCDIGSHEYESAAVEFAITVMTLIEED